MKAVTVDTPKWKTVDVGACQIRACYRWESAATGARMQAGSLSEYFAGVGAKTLTGTEVDPKVSNGHEFQGVDSFRAFLGIPDEKTSVPVNWVWLSDEEAPLVLPLPGTWYDSRRGKGHRAQTDEMRKECLKLVVPRALHSSYRPAQQEELAAVADFLDLVRATEAVGQGILI